MSMAGFLVNCSSAAVQLKTKQSQSLRLYPYALSLPMSEDHQISMLGRRSVRCYSTLRAWSPVCGSTLRVSHVCHGLGPLGFAVLRKNLSLLEGLEFTLLRVLQQKGIYTCLVRIIKFSFSFSV